jgi:hypothetical protein
LALLHLLVAEAVLETATVMRRMLEVLAVHLVVEHTTLVLLEHELLHLFKVTTEQVQVVGSLVVAVVVALVETHFHLFMIPATVVLVCHQVSRVLP